MSKLQFGKIDDNYIHDNLDEIVNLMTEILPEKASNSRNWRRNMKKEDASDNLSYIRNLRDINYFLQEELISRMDETDYHNMMSEEFGHNKY